jgi:serine/threonine-protein kinase
MERDPKLGIADTVPTSANHAAGDHTVAREAPSVRYRAPRSTGGSLARYRLEEVLGAGGMGEVVSAHDEQIGRSVAIKRMHAKDPTPEATARFLREARIQGRLEHPAVVPVYELEHDEQGNPFFVMKQLTGTTLAAALAKPDAAASRRNLLRAFVDVCLAIEFAHAHGIVHRDLKPSNIVLGDFGEVYVLDWGIARVVGDASNPAVFIDVNSLEIDGTRTGVVLGTPGYMAPEQLRGVADLDGRADIYALGCILYELLARKSLHARGPDALYTTLEHVDARPSVHAPDVPLELDAICVRATKLDRNERYDTPRELSDDVQRFLDGDLDVALRRQLAQTEVATARDALAAGDSPSERRTAMRAAARALALDPTNREPAELVGRLMLEPPRDTPPEVVERLHRIERDVHDAARMRLRRASLVGVAFAPVAWLGGLPLWYDLILFVAALATYLIRGSRETSAWYFDDVPWLLVSAATSVVTTPFLVVPEIIAIIALVEAGLQPVARPGRLIFGIALILAAVLVPWLLTIFGVLPRNVAVVGNTLVLTCMSDHVEPTIGLTALPATLVALTLVVLACMRSIVNQRRDVQAKLEVQAWQLRQLIPSPERSSPPSSRGNATVRTRHRPLRSRSAVVADRAPRPTETSLARYQLEEVLGTDSTGEVVSAQDEQIGRSVAIKRIRAKDPTPEATARFLREARIQGRLEHPAVVPVHELQHDEHGHPFFVMKRNVGTTLAAALQKPDAASRRNHLRAFVDVCLAIEFAHARGVVHSDLTPSNIMLGDFGEVYVLNWGIARVVQDAPSRAVFSDIDPLELDGTRTAVAPGTPGYMAPEQLRCVADLDGRADIYALGCILYELLARRSLHPRGRAALSTTLQEVDARASIHDADVAPELDAICVRATKLDRNERYETVRALGEAVQRYLDGERNIALRKQLAETELAAARAILGAGHGPHERETAMRAAARALALDPTNRAPADLVGRLMLEPPREVPSEVVETITRSEQEMVHVSRVYLRRATLGFLAIASTSLRTGLHAWCAAVMLISLLASISATYVIPRTHEKAMWRVAWSAGLTVVAALSAGTTPFMFVPEIVMIIAVFAAATYQRWIVGLALAAALVPWFLTLVGMLPHNVAITGNAFVLTVASDQLEPTLMLIALVAALVAVTTIIVASVHSIINDRRKMEIKLAVQAWQLGQLVPAHE